MAKNSDEWVKLHRKIMDKKYWFSEPFTPGQAWVDLLLLVNRNTRFNRRCGISLEVPSGKTGCPKEALAERWKWPRGKVRRFISELASDNSVDRVPAVQGADRRCSMLGWLYKWVLRRLQRELQGYADREFDPKISNALDGCDAVLEHLDGEP